MPAGGSGIANIDGLLQPGEGDLQRLAVVVEQRVALLPPPHMPFLEMHCGVEGAVVALAGFQTDHSDDVPLNDRPSRIICSSSR